MLLLYSICCFVHTMRRLQVLRVFRGADVVVVMLLSGVVLVVLLKNSRKVYNKKNKKGQSRSVIPSHMRLE